MKLEETRYSDYENGDYVNIGVPSSFEVPFLVKRKGNFMCV